MSNLTVELQTCLGIDVTGEFNKETLNKAYKCDNKNIFIIKWLQRFLNSLNCPQKVDITGLFDVDTKQVLTYFQKEYGYKYKRIPITAELDKPTWELIGEYLNHIE